MTIEEVLKYFGTQMHLARKVGVSRQAVYQWTKAGYVPYLQQLRIEEITEGELEFSYEHIGGVNPRKK